MYRLENFRPALRSPGSKYPRIGGIVSTIAGTPAVCRRVPRDAVSMVSCTSRYTSRRRIRGPDGSRLTTELTFNSHWAEMGACCA